MSGCVAPGAAFVSQGCRPQRVIGVGIGRMVVIVAVAVIVAVSAGVTVVVMGCVLSVRLTGSCAFRFAHGAAVRKTLYVVMMTFLGAAHVLLEAKNLSSVFAEGAVHGVSPRSTSSTRSRKVSTTIG